MDIKINKKKKYKALMLDVDGTLVPNRQDGMPSIKVANAIKKIKGSVHVCIVTGRILRDLHNILDYLELTDPIIIDNGTRIIDPRSKKVLWEKAIDHADLQEILNGVRKFSKTAWMTEERKIIQFSPTYVPEKLFAIYIPGFLPTEADQIEHKLSEISSITTHRQLSWTPEMIDISITHAAATKQHGIFEVAKMLGIETHEIIGVGDGYNDFPLLMACGLKIAMGNAVDELKTVADYVAPTVDEDGVSDVIEKFVLKNP